jgi:hypothetical protein
VDFRQSPRASDGFIYFIMKATDGKIDFAAWKGRLGQEISSCRADRLAANIAPPPDLRANSTKP